MVSIKQKWLIIAAYLMLAVPICVFMLGWLHVWWGLLGTIVVLGCLVRLFVRDWRSEEKAVTLPIGHLAGIVVFFLLMVALSGTCQIGVSDSDIPWRNALFHDLVTHDWPVVYDNGTALTYYVAFWMIPALFGKLCGLTVGYAALLVWITLLLTIVFLLVVCFLGFETPGKMWLVGVFVVLWSGMHYLAAAFVTVMGWNAFDYGILHDGSAYMDYFFNGESFNWYYRSNYSVLSQTYNQLMIWVAVAVMLSKRNPRNYMALGLMVMPYSPWGFIGLIPLLIAAAIPGFVDAARTDGALGVVKEIFSVENVCVTLVVAVVFGSYFLASTASSGIDGAVVSAEEIAQAQEAGLPYTTQTGSFGLLSFDRMGLGTLFHWVLFCFFEFGLFTAFLFRDHKKDGLFWTAIVVLMVVPFIWAGSIDGRDFCMNASIPSIFVFMCFMLEYLGKRVCGQPLKLPQLVLVVALVFSLCGSAFVTCDKAGELWRAREIAHVNNSIETLDGKDFNDYKNFLSNNYGETFFFKYLAK